MNFRKTYQLKTNSFKILAYIILCISSIISNAQVEEFTISYRFKESSLENAFFFSEVEEFPTGGYILGGNGYRTNNIDLKNIVLIRLNEELDTVWARVINSGKEDFFKDFILDNAGNIYLSMDTRFFNDKGGPEISGALLKINPEGELVWGRNILSNTFTVLRSTEIVGDTLISIIGDYGSGGRSIDPILTQITTDGDLKFSTVYSKRGAEFVRSNHIVSSDGSSYVVSQTFAENSNFNVNISKISAEGVFLWGKTYASNTIIKENSTVSLTSPPLIYNGSIYFNAYSYGLTGNNEKKWFFKTDLDGNIKKVVSIVSTDPELSFFKSLRDAPFIHPLRNTYSNTIRSSKRNFLAELDTSFSEIKTNSHREGIDNLEREFFEFSLNKEKDGIFRFGGIKDLNLPNPSVTTFGITPLSGDCFLREDEETNFQIIDEQDNIQIVPFTVSNFSFGASSFEPPLITAVLTDSLLSCADGSIIPIDDRDEEDDTPMEEEEETPIDEEEIDDPIEEELPFKIFRKYSSNLDGLNDCLYIEGLDKFDSNQVYLYDKLGEIVFIKKNYTNDSYCFDDLPVGIYYLYLNLNDGEEIHRTNILLKK